MGEHIVCPSGLSGEVRGLTTKDANILANANGRQRSSAINKILTACWEETTDQGPYSFDGSPSWREALQGDRQYALIAIRKATHGSEYEFGLSCPECRERFDWRMSLDELPVVVMSDEDRAAFKVANKFEAHAGGHTLWYRLPTGADEERAQRMKAQHRDALVTLALRMRIVSVDDVDVSKIGDFINNMPLRDATDLLEVFQEHDCGIETELEVECPSCGLPFDVELPFEGSFFLPSGKKKAKKKRAMAAAI